MPHAPPTGTCTARNDSRAQSQNLDKGVGRRKDPVVMSGHSPAAEDSTLSQETQPRRKPVIRIRALDDVIASAATHDVITMVMRDGSSTAIRLEISGDEASLSMTFAGNRTEIARGDADAMREAFTDIEATIDARVNGPAETAPSTEPSPPAVPVARPGRVFVVNTSRPMVAGVSAILIAALVTVLMTRHPVAPITAVEGHGAAPAVVSNQAKDGYTPIQSPVQLDGQPATAGALHGLPRTSKLPAMLAAIKDIHEKAARGEIHAIGDIEDDLAKLPKAASDRLRTVIMANLAGGTATAGQAPVSSEKVGDTAYSRLPTDKYGVPKIPDEDLWSESNGTVVIPLPGGGDMQTAADLSIFVKK